MGTSPQTSRTGNASSLNPPCASLAGFLFLASRFSFADGSRGVRAWDRNASVSAAKAELARCCQTWTASPGSGIPRCSRVPSLPKMGTIETRSVASEARWKANPDRLARPSC
ncbi:hypothetical protein Hsc_3133 [Herbaspirillum seropedicae]|nr:hypothetical protein Hsc_3133 [Herbaspirillum seropedicae]